MRGKGKSEPTLGIRKGCSKSFVLPWGSVQTPLAVCDPHYAKGLADFTVALLLPCSSSSFQLHHDKKWRLDTKTHFITNFTAMIYPTLIQIYNCHTVRTKIPIVWRECNFTQDSPSLGGADLEKYRHQRESILKVRKIPWKSRVDKMMPTKHGGTGLFSFRINDLKGRKKASPEILGNPSRAIIWY